MESLPSRNIRVKRSTSKNRNAALSMSLDSSSLMMRKIDTRSKLSVINTTRIVDNLVKRQCLCRSRYITRNIIDLKWFYKADFTSFPNTSCIQWLLPLPNPSNRLTRQLTTGSFFRSNSLIAHFIRRSWKSSIDSATVAR